MRLTEYLKPENIKLPLAATEKTAAIEELIDLLHAHGEIRDVEKVRKAVLEREATRSTGIGDGEYLLGAMRVRVADGQARLADSGALAGSTLTMGDAVRRAVKDVGLSIETASRYASAVPARVLGLTDRGTLTPGARADLVFLDEDLRVIEVP